MGVLPQSIAVTLNTNRIIVERFDYVGDADRYRIITGTIGKVELFNTARRN